MRAVVKVERNRNVRPGRQVEVERRHEESQPGCARWQALGEIAFCPGGRVESGEVPALTLAECTAFVEDASNLVGESGGCEGSEMERTKAFPCTDTLPCVTTDLALDFPSRECARVELEAAYASG